MSVEEFWEYEYRVTGADEDDPWTRAPRVLADAEELRITDVELGVAYDVRARCIDSRGRASAWTLIEAMEPEGATAPPAPVTDVRVGPCGVTWSDPDRSVNVVGYRLRHAAGDYRYFPGMDEAHPGIWPEPPFPKCFLPPGVRAIAVTAVDADGRESEPVITIAELDTAPPLANAIATQNQYSLGWPGTIQGGSNAGLTLDAGVDPNDFFWAQPRGADLIWDPDDQASYWPADAVNFWPQDIGDEEPFWPVDDALEFWDPRYLPLVYTFTVTPAPAAAAEQLAVAVSASVPGARVEFRTQDDLFWDLDPILFWDADDNAYFWPQTEAPWRPWPGTVQSLTPQNVEFRVTLPGGLVQGQVTGVIATVTAPDQLERFANVAIPVEGRRLAPAGRYSRVALQELLVHHGSAAVSAVFADLDATRGPLVFVLNGSGVPTSGVIDATLRGF